MENEYISRKHSQVLLEMIKTEDYLKKKTNRKERWNDEIMKFGR